MGGEKAKTRTRVTRARRIARRLGLMGTLTWGREAITPLNPLRFNRMIPAVPVPPAASEHPAFPSRLDL